MKPSFCRDPKFIPSSLTVTVGGVYQRNYSPLVVYKLTNLIEGKVNDLFELIFNLFY
jgi:hypothetical protein